MAKRQPAIPSPAPKRLIGYARVSTEDQVHDAQMTSLDQFIEQNRDKFVIG